MRSVTISVPHLRFLFSDGSNIRYYTTYNATLSTYATGGNTTTCTTSTMTDQANTNWLATLNMFRSFAGVSAVAIDHSKDSMTSGCALMSAANNQLMHGGWTSSNLCYSTTAADGCSADLTAGERNPMEAVSNLISDYGVVDVGHRTSLLYVFPLRGGSKVTLIFLISKWNSDPDLGPVSMGWFETPNADTFVTLWAVSTDLRRTTRGIFFFLM